MVTLSKLANDEDEIKRLIEENRKMQESIEDEKLKKRETKKLEKEIANPRIKRDPMLDETPVGHSDEQSKLLRDFDAAKEKDSGDVDTLLSNPEYVVQEPPGGWRCMNEGHQARPASLKLQHGGVLGEGMGDLYFCEECAYKFKTVPMGPAREEVSRWVKGGKLDSIKKLASISEKCDSIGLFDISSTIESIMEKLI